MKKYGPRTKHVRELMDTVHNLTEEKIAAILAVHEVVGIDNPAVHHAWAAAREAGFERELARAAEDGRYSIWEAIVPCGWEEGWTLSWILSRAVIAEATWSLVGRGDYTVDDYVTLSGVWNAIPREEGAE